VKWVGYEYEIGIYIFEIHSRVYEHQYGIVTKKIEGEKTNSLP